MTDTVEKEIDESQIVEESCSELFQKAETVVQGTGRDIEGQEMKGIA